MAKFFDALTPEHEQFIAEQHVFFVATAASGARVNLSPKGMDTLRILDPRTVAYLDLTGSGNETAAHVAAGGPMTIMLCSFDRQPLILRLYGRGEVAPLASERGRRLGERFTDEPGARQVIVLHIESLQTSCGYGVPVMGHATERDTLRRWAASRGEEKLRATRRERNVTSIDGLPAPPFGEA